VRPGVFAGRTRPSGAK